MTKYYTPLFIHIIVCAFFPVPRRGEDLPILLAISKNQALVPRIFLISNSIIFGLLFILSVFVGFTLFLYDSKLNTLIFNLCSFSLWIMNSFKTLSFCCIIPREHGLNNVDSLEFIEILIFFTGNFVNVLWVLEKNVYSLSAGCRDLIQVSKLAF